MKPEIEPNVDILFFTKGGNSVEDKYSISKEFLKEGTFVLKYKGDIFLKEMMLLRIICMKDLRSGYTNLASS